MNETSAKRTCLCECVNFAFVSGDTVCLDFIWPGPAPKAGQFFLVRPKRTGVFLARPLSMAGWKSGRDENAKEIDRRFMTDRRSKPDTKTDPRTDTITYSKADNSRKIERRKNFDRRTEPGGIIRFYVTRRGRGSRELSELRPGEEAELTGPLGNSWPLGLFQTVHPAVQATVHAADHHKGKQADTFALVGGGARMAPLLSLAAELKKGHFDFYAGFRTGSFGLENIKPRALIISTEDGSQGVKGRILDFFNISGYSGVFACGPAPMLKELADICVAGGVPCFVSAERNMACGVGACLGCKVKTTKKDLRCCTDGPIFNAEDIYFEG